MPLSSRQRAIALLVAACFFMENLDTTIVTTAAPAMSRTLGVEPVVIGVVVSAYVVTLCALIPVSAWFCRRFPPRLVFMAAIVIFTAASAGCAFATDLGVMVAMRIVQGIGGALMVPVGRTVVLAVADRSQIVRLMNFIIWPGLLAFPLAPAIGGLLVTYASWPWIFAVNIPLGVVALGCATVLLPRTAPPSNPPRFDWAGALGVIAGLGGLTCAATLIADHGPVAVIITLAVVGAAATVTVVRHLRSAATPLLDIRLLSIGSFGMSQLAILLLFVPVTATPYVLPLLYQVYFGWSPLTAGAVVIAIFVGNIAAKPTTKLIMSRFGFRDTAAYACFALAVVTVALGVIPAALPLAVPIAVAVAAGAFRSIALSALAAVTMADIAPDQRADANALTSVVQQLGSGVAIAVAMVALTIGAALSSGQGQYVVACATLAVCCVGAAVAALRLHPRAGHDLLHS